VAQDAALIDRHRSFDGNRNEFCANAAKIRLFQTAAIPWISLSDTGLVKRTKMDDYAEWPISPSG
jgi:hypothetical protein